MKKLTLAVFIAASLFSFVSCTKSEEKSYTSNPLIGKWKIDSIATDEDNLIGIFIIASLLNDSASYNVIFTPDAVTIYENETTNCMSYTFDATKRQLYLQEDALLLSYHSINPSFIQLTSKDGTRFYLRRK